MNDLMNNKKVMLDVVRISPLGDQLMGGLVTKNTPLFVTGLADHAALVVLNVTLGIRLF